MQYGSYSSARLSLLQAYRTFRGMQKLLITQFLRRVWHWKISQFMLHEGLREPKVGAGCDPMWAAWRHIWQPDGWEWIDPEKTANANALMLDRSMTTLDEYAKQRGVDAKQLIDGRARDIKRAMDKAKELGLDDWRDILRADTRSKVSQGAGGG